MSNVFDRYVKEYDMWYNKNQFAYLSELEVLKKVLPKKGTGLEIGVGTARFAAPLGIKFGIDTSRKMLKIARARGIDVKLASGENLPFNNSLFDYVIVINTLCFVKHPLKVLEEAKRVLKKTGKIIVGIIDKNSFLGKTYQKKKSLFYNKAHFLGVKEVINLLRTVGLKRISCYQTLFSFPDDITLIEKPRRGFGTGGFVVISAHR